MGDEDGLRGKVHGRAKNESTIHTPWDAHNCIHHNNHVHGSQPRSTFTVALAPPFVRAGIPIPPLNLQAARAQQKLADPWAIADHSLAAAAAAAAGQPPGSGTARSSTPRTPGRGSSRGDGGAGAPPGSADNSARGSSRSRQRYGAWYVAPKEWKTVYGNGGGSGAGTPSRGPTDTGMVAAGGVAEGPAGFVPGSKEAELAIELGGSYTARVYREHLKANNMRTPGVLERVHTPTEDEVRRMRRPCPQNSHGSGV